VVALSLGGLRRRIEALMMPDEPHIVLDFGLPPTLIKGGGCGSGMYDLKPVRLSKRSGENGLDGPPLQYPSPRQHQIVGCEKCPHEFHLAAKWSHFHVRPGISVMEMCARTGVEKGDQTWHFAKRITPPNTTSLR
jgi:hypothetical protein